ncbi:MAG: iron-siderophore ABC transporter substrate-binding protein [Solirubrobacteraceae bacterium MAG38_C4-C5]|nr:iron-siderophore ABC transporter substrate-binding protein [Candidatus Siliceabacter maunaloa]
MAGGLALGAAVFVGCGEDDTGEAPTGEGAGAFPATIEHKYGSTGVPAPPKRVVTVGFGEQDFPLALGVIPVAVREFFGGQPSENWSWARDELGDAKPELLPVAELNFEQVAALRPDLILGSQSGMTEKDYETLSQIAPTIAQSNEFVDFGQPWQETLRVTGRALGRGEHAEDIVAELEGQFAGAREAHPEFEGAAAVFATVDGDGNFGAYTGQEPRARFLAALGFKTPDEIDRRADGESFTEISTERFRLLDQDVLVMLEIGEAGQDTIEKNPIYARLNAVREGRDIYVEYLDELSGALSYNSPLSLPYAIEEMVPRLATAVDGDPSTEVEEPRRVPDEAP